MAEFVKKVISSARRGVFPRKGDIFRGIWFEAFEYKFIVGIDLIADEVLNWMRGGVRWEREGFGRSWSL